MRAQLDRSFTGDVIEMYSKCSFSLQSLVNGGARVTLHLKKFTNTDDKLWDGSNCDFFGGLCDNIFELCVKAYPPLPSSPTDSCMYHKTTSYFEGTTIDFEGTSTGIKTDITLEFSPYKVSLNLSFSVSHFPFNNSATAANHIKIEKAKRSPAKYRQN